MCVCVCEGEGPYGQTCFELLLKTSKRAGNEVRTNSKQIYEQLFLICLFV